MIRLSAATGLATALVAVFLLALPTARADEAREFAGQALYHMLGAMLVEGATNDHDDLPDYIKPDGGLFAGDDDMDIPTSIPPENYAASDAISNQGFSPEEGVICYPKQGLCFKKNGKPDIKWTNRIFAN